MPHCFQFNECAVIYICYQCQGQPYENNWYNVEHSATISAGWGLQGIGSATTQCIRVVSVVDGNIKFKL